MPIRRFVPALFATFFLGFPQLPAQEKAAVSSLKPESLKEFTELSKPGQELLRYALELTRRNLRYRYGSNDPANGGMDCSGTVSHILNRQGFAAPRMAHLIYLWADNAKTLIRVKNCHALSDPQLARLRPGDLLFWEGTYDIGNRRPPISHVMIYLGHEKSTGRPVMVGASSGRYYAGRPRHGVSVFDFVMPSAKSESKFVAYARVPGLERASPSPAPVTAAAPGPGQIPAVQRPAAGTPVTPAVAAPKTPPPSAPPATETGPPPFSVRTMLRRVFGP